MGDKYFTGDKYLVGKVKTLSAYFSDNTGLLTITALAIDSVLAINTLLVTLLVTNT